MARIRTIKPELPQSESLGRLSRDARLLFVNLFTIADDCGRLRGHSRLLASLLYPYDDGLEGRVRTTGADVEKWMAELHREGCISRYDVDGVAYTQIVKWLEHQKIDRPSPSRLPEPPAITREESRASDALPRTVDLGPTPFKPPKGGVAYSGDFESWWETYPHKVGKDAAFRKWKLAIKRVDLQTLLDAAKRYIAAKPIDREWCNPATWLGQGRWQDAPATGAESATAGEAPVRMTRDDEFWRKTITFWQRTKIWPYNSAGPQFGSGGCEIPAHIISEFNLDGMSQPPFLKRSA